MKRNALLFALVISASSALAQGPIAPRGDISSILELQSSFTQEYTYPLEPSPFYGEQMVIGCVKDFNGDRVDDFIINGLREDGGAVKTFLQIYLGQKNGDPKLVYDNQDFTIGGNGSIDCEKLNDGNFLVAIQGGTNGNWTPPYGGYLYKLSVDSSDQVTFDLTTQLPEIGCGRGSIRLLDADGDGALDIFQNGWAINNPWTAYARVYQNIDGESNEMFDLVADNGVRPAANTFTVKGDINGDGKIDLLVPIQDSGLFAYISNGDGTFTEIAVTSFSGIEREDGMNLRSEDDTSEADLIDVDGDGLPEIVLASTNDATGTWEFILKLYKYNDGVFTEIPAKNKAGDPAVWIGGQRGDFAITDFDGDGNQDIVLCVENQDWKYLKTDDKGVEVPIWGCRSYFLSGNGQGGFDQFECTLDDSDAGGIVPGCRRAQFGRVLKGDFNGDGQPDLIQMGPTFAKKYSGLRYYKNVVVGGNFPSAIENTVSDKITISVINKELHINGAADSQVTVMNLSGVACNKMNVESSNAVLPLNIATGIYIVEVKSQSGVTSQKVIIK